MRRSSAPWGLRPAPSSTCSMPSRPPLSAKASSRSPTTSSAAIARAVMTPAERVAELRAEIRRHEELYYLHDNPELTDAEFDGLMHELAALEAAHPELQDAASPTMRVGGPPKASIPRRTWCRCSASITPTAMRSYGNSMRGSAEDWAWRSPRNWS